MIAYKKYLKYIIKQYSNHVDEFCKTWDIVQNRRLRELKAGFIELIALIVLGIHAFFTFVNILVLILRTLTCWIRTNNDHIFIEASILLILVGLAVLHIYPALIQQDNILSDILIGLVCWILVDVMLVLFRIVFLNQYRTRIGWVPVSVNRTLILLVLNFFEISLCFSVFYLSSQSIGLSGSGDVSFVMCSLQSLYFSIVTISTLGYGDFRPISPWGQRLVILEVVAGFLFVTVIFAHVIQFTKRDASLNDDQVLEDDKE